jgi:hypothetical protein
MLENIESGNGIENQEISEKNFLVFSFGLYTACLRPFCV